jgi:hypothetical protein
MQVRDREDGARVGVGGQQFTGGGNQENSRPPSRVQFSDVPARKTSAHSFSDSGFAQVPARKDTVLTRHSAGSTPYNKRLDHRSQDYSKSVEFYHVLPSVVDYPYQARNPALHKPNPVRQNAANSEEAVFQASAE